MYVIYCFSTALCWLCGHIVVTSKINSFFYLYQLSRSFHAIVSVYIGIDSKGVYSALICAFQHLTPLAKEQPLQIGFSRVWQVASWAILHPRTQETDWDSWRALRDIILNHLGNKETNCKKEIVGSIQDSKQTHNATDNRWWMSMRCVWRWWRWWTSHRTQVKRRPGEK